MTLATSACGNGSMFSDEYQQKWSGYYDRPGAANAAAQMWMYQQQRYIDETWPSARQAGAVRCTTSGVDTICVPDSRY